MKNVIKNQKLFFISLIGIIVVSSILIYTYAYQSLQVVYKSGSKEKLTINAGVLDVTFAVTNRLNITSMPLLSSYKSAEYSEFTISNTKSSDDAAYKVSITDMTYTSNLVSSDFNYTLVNADTNEIVSEDNFSNLTGTSIELTDFITLKKNNSVKLRLYLWLKETTSNQNNLENASFKGKVEITSMFDKEVPKKLVDAILASAETAKTNSDATRTTLGSTVTEFTSISGANEHVLNNAPDDYGTSYYFRGNVKDNYVSFADKTWRIVRINGDGTVRLILDDVAKDSNGNKISTVFNTSSNDNAYIGYMYGTVGSTTYDATHENINDSKIKQAVDKWYEDNLKTNYANYLSDTLFCNDKTLASSTIGDSNTALGYGTNITYYASTERLEYSTGETEITTAKPTFKCAESATNDYSRFTVDVATLANGNKTNGNLKYPIGLLSADEVSYAGAYKFGHDSVNKSYYLYNSSITSYWRLSSPHDYDGSYAGEWVVSGSNGYIINSLVYSAYALRPSINLKAELLVGGGDGTSSNPYTVKIS